MERYRIIDEPEAKSWAEQLIVDPIVILLAAILVPLFWQPPLFGRFWIPMLWIVFNGYALGSPTLGKEIRTLVGGLAAWFLLLVPYRALMVSGTTSWTQAQVIPYVVILQFGVFFLAMYLVVFRQSTSYALYRYVSGDER